MYERIFAEGGTLAQHLERFEPRAVQMDVAEAVALACREGQLLLLEAGTGVGKSLAYLVPLMEWIKQSGRRAVVSTCTKTLQHQLMTQDIPLARKVTGLDVSYALGLGAENYFCQQRMDQALRGGGAGVRFSGEFKVWAATTRSGIRDECPVRVPDRVWHQVCRSPEFCPPSICRPGGKCFFQRARAAVRKAGLVIANHYLLFADMRSGRSILGDYDVLVLDEAHDLEEIATRYLGYTLTHRGAAELLSTIGLSRGPHGVLDACPALDDGTRHDIRMAADQTHGALETLCQDLRVAFGGGPGRTRVRRDLTQFDEISPPIEALRDLVTSAAQSLKNTDSAGRLDGIAESLGGLAETVREVLGPHDEGTVRWIEWDDGQVSLVGAAPIEIGGLLQAQLYSQLHSTILVSATLRVGKKFEFFQERTGSEAGVARAFDSPFDFANHMVLYVPGEGPEPEAGLEYLEYLARQIEALAERVHGGCFALFTNRSHMLEVHRMLAETGAFRTRDDPAGFMKTRLLLCQGELERGALIDTFRRDGEALLLGTNTFWQGVDVPGDALRCVILCRFPFRVPDDPVMEARVERLKAQDRNAFMDYQLPQAVMMFLQGAGRLIRHKDDTGVVAILDQRMRTKRYGRLFYDSLPACTGTASLDDVAEIAGKRGKG